MTDLSIIEEAITETFGERCPDTAEGCWCCEAWAAFDQMSQAEAKLEKAREALNRLLVCPAIADEDHNDPEWGDGETADASSFARATLKEIGGDDA